MNVALWIVAGVLAVAYLAGGLAMLTLTKERFRALGHSVQYVDDFDAGFIKALGAVKLLASAGLILPAVLDIQPVLVPVAATGLVLLMTGATTVRIVRREFRYALGDLVFLGLAAFVAIGRFAIVPFGA